MVNSQVIRKTQKRRDRVLRNGDTVIGFNTMTAAGRAVTALSDIVPAGWACLGPPLAMRPVNTATWMSS